MGTVGKRAPEKVLGMSREISAYLDAATCLLIVAFLFYPAPLAGLLDAKFLALFGFALVVFMFAGRGVFALLLILAIEIFGFFAKSTNNTVLVGLYQAARGFFIYNFIAFCEGFCWMALFGLIFIAHLSVASTVAKETLLPMAHDSFSMLRESRILGMPQEDEYPFFTLLLFFMASTFFGLFVVKKWNISIASKVFAAMREMRPEKYGNGETYEDWVRVYARQEQLD